MKAHAISVVALLVVVVCVFHTVLLPPRPLLGSDSPLGATALGRERLLSGKSMVWGACGYLGMGGGETTAGLLTSITYALPPQYFNTFVCPFFVFLAGLGMYLFCLSLDLKSLPAFVGACALMLSGDFVTATLSGHGGKFVMWAAMMFTIWLITLAFKKRNFLAFCWCGVCWGIGLTGQFDVCCIVSLFFVAWGLFLAWQTRALKEWPMVICGLFVAAILGAAFSVTMLVYVLALSH